jgi:SRSO17 transposase
MTLMDNQRVEIEQVESWAAELDALMQRIGPRFVRSEARQRARAYLQGLLSPAQRKNGWQLAEVMGDATPYGVQQFLYRAVWKPDELRDDLRAYVVDVLGDAEAVLIVDETGFLKKGHHSAGVKRQYSGTAGRIENCQMGVFLAYASRHGHAFLDRALYVPEEWANDPARRQAAGIPEEVTFASKPDLAWDMLRQAVAHQVPFTWVTADSIYGDYHSLRLWLEGLLKRYVLAVSRKDTVVIDGQPQRVGELLEALPQAGWQRLSAGEGAKGPRLYDWYWTPLLDPLVAGWKRWLLVRRSLSDPTELAAYVCFAPADTPLSALVRVAGQRWVIEASLEEAKDEVGLDQYEVRSWTGWYRHITLALLAHALLAVIQARTAASDSPAAKKGAWFPPQTRHSLAAFKARRGLSCL